MPQDKSITLSGDEAETLFAFLRILTLDHCTAPVTMLAQSIGVPVATASRRLSKLSGLGLLDKIGRGAYRPSEVAIDYHRHAPGEPCLRITRTSSSLMTGIADTVAATDEGCIISGGHRVGTSAFAKAGKGKVAVYETAKPRKRMAKTQLDALANLFMHAYAEFRRQYDPGYQPLPGDYKQAASVVRAAKTRFVDPPLYTAYIEYATDVYRGFKNVRSPFAVPPVATLKSHTIMDGYVSTLPKRRINVEKAKQVLLAKRIDVPNVAVAVAIARRAMEESESIPSGLPEKYKVAAQAVMDNFYDIGYSYEEV